MSDYVPCPKCGNHDVSKPGFTWWGGAIGPKLLSHVKCNSCKHSYNGKTGNPNTTNIILYNVVVFVVFFVLFFSIFRILFQ